MSLRPDYRDVLNALPEPHWLLEGGRIVAANGPAAKLVGRRRESLVGAAVTDLIADQAGKAARFLTMCARSPQMTPGALTFRAADGREVACRCDGAVVRPAGEAAPALVLETAREVTDARRLRSHLETTQRLEAIARLAGGAAHEINNALQGAVGFATFALDRLPAGHAAADDVSQVLKSSERAAAITRGLLAFSRRQLLQPSDVNLVEAIEEFAPMCRQAIGADRVLRLELPAVPVMAFADRGQLEQMLLNFALNAHDATGPGGMLRIRLDVAALEPAELARLGRPDLGPGHFARIEVEDSGHGMDDEPIVLALATRILIEAGYTVLTADNGTEALRRLAEAETNGGQANTPVHLVLSDVMMPGLDGRELGLQLARPYPGLPLLYTSGHPGEEMTERGLLSEDAAFIQKPFRPEQLLVNVRGMLDRTGPT